MEQFNKLFEDIGVKGISMGETMDQIATVNTTEVSINEKLTDLLQNVRSIIWLIR